MTMTVQPCSHTICAHGTVPVTARGRPRRGGQGPGSQLDHGEQHRVAPAVFWAAPRLLGDAHLPEVGDGVGQGALRGDVRRHPRVVLDLQGTAGSRSASQVPGGLCCGIAPLGPPISLTMGLALMKSLREGLLSAFSLIRT